MKLNYLPLLSPLLLLMSCSSPEERQAEQLFHEAETAFQSSRYYQAGALLDSLERNCKQAIEWRKAGHTLNYQVQLALQQDSLATADSMLIAITPLINEMVEAGHFVYEKGEMDELGRFWVKGTDVQSNLGRCYIHAVVNEYGAVQLISEYRGGSHIEHTQLRLVGGDGSEMTSQDVPLSNDGANYRFRHGGLCHESVTYVNDPVLGYIDMHVSDTKMKAILLYRNGAKSYPIQLAEQDRQSIALSYQLGKMLAAQLHFTQQSKVAAGKIRFLQQKLDKQNETAK